MIGRTLAVREITCGGSGYNPDQEHGIQIDFFFWDVTYSIVTSSLHPAGSRLLKGPHSEGTTPPSCPTAPRIQSIAVRKPSMMHPSGPPPTAPGGHTVPAGSRSSTEASHQLDHHASCDARSLNGSVTASTSDRARAAAGKSLLPGGGGGGGGC